MKIPIPHIEIVLERIGPCIIRSELVVATENEQVIAGWRYALTGECEHYIVVDEPGWMYDFRSCRTCGKGLGAI